MKKPEGMRAFIVVWLGQIVSIFGSVMTNFALLIWIWTKTGEATPFAIFGFAAFTPLIIATPIAGVLVDRWNRKLTMMLSDLAAGFTSVMILILFSLNALELWHLYILGAFSGFFGAFQFPAFSASISLMVSKQHYVRASGMQSMAGTASGLFGPVFAAMLLAFIGIRGILIIDIITFTFAVTTLLFVNVPQPKAPRIIRKGLKGFWEEIHYGFKYIFDRKPLLSLLIIFLFINVFFSIGNTIRAPMILARSNDNQYVFATVQTVAALGGLAGGFILTAWGGPTKRIKGLFLSMGLASLFGFVLMGLGREIIIWSIASFFTLFFLTFTTSLSQAFWQSKVTPEIQGRVFATRRLIAQISIPLATIIAGPLADNLFEPGMDGGGFLSSTFGSLVGTEFGSGMSLMYLLVGIASVFVTVFGYTLYHVREAENILPDFDLNPETKTT